MIVIVFIFYFCLFFAFVFGRTFLNYICFYISFSFSLLLFYFNKFYSASLCSSRGQKGEKNACVFFLLFQFHWNTAQDDLLSMWLLTATEWFVFRFWFYFGFINYWTVKKTRHNKPNENRELDFIRMKTNLYGRKRWMVNYETNRQSVEAVVFIIVFVVVCAMKQINVCFRTALYQWIRPNWVRSQHT